MQKRSKYIHLWKTRFFILTQRYLFAFTGVENDADCTMALQLNNVDSVSLKNTSQKEFVVKTLSGNYYLRAENNNIRERWVSEINKALKSNKSESLIFKSNGNSEKGKIIID